MTVPFDTAGVDVGERSDRWAAASAQLFVPLRVTAPADQPFSGRADQRPDARADPHLRHHRERRLERCRAQLRDPAHAHETVATIAARWGRVESSHFSRIFRRAYGMSPRDFRRA